MRRPITWLLFACSFALCGCGNLRDRAVLSTGSWTVERVELDGKDVTDESFEVSFAPNNEAITITVGDVVHKGLYELDSAKDPKEIDIKPEASNLTDKPLKGIYAIESDGCVLMLCLSPTKRPKKFETAETNNVLIKLTREKQANTGAPQFPNLPAPPVVPMPPTLGQRINTVVYTQLAPPLFTDTATITLSGANGWREQRILNAHPNITTQTMFFVPGEGMYQYEISSQVRGNFGRGLQLANGKGQGEIRIEAGKRLVYGRTVDPTKLTCTCTLQVE